MKRFFLLFIAGSLLMSCGGNNGKQEAAGTGHKHTEGEKEHGEGEEGHEEENGNIAEISQKQMRAVGITLDTLQYRDLTSSIKANGMLNVPNQNKAIVTSIVDGIIKTLAVLPGDYVRKGQLIATIINPDIARMQQELQTTLAQIRLAETEQRRQQELVEGNAAPLKNLQQVQTQLATLHVTRNALRQQLGALGLSASSVEGGKINTTVSILAPISGTISSVTAEIGSQINAAMPIAKIVNNSELHLDLFIYEKDLSLVKNKQEIHFTLTNNPGKTFDAQVFSIGAAFENDTKTIPVHAIVKGNKAGLIEGMNVTALINTGVSTQPALPVDAIVSNAGHDYIFVLVGKEAPKDKEEGEVYAFEKWPVAKGITDLGYTAITPVKPIPAGASIITKGTFFALAKLTNQGEHEH